MKKSPILLVLPLVLFAITCKKDIRETVITIIGSVGDVKVIEGRNDTQTVILGKDGIVVLVYAK